MSLPFSHNLLSRPASSNSIQDVFLRASKSIRSWKCKNLKIMSSYAFNSSSNLNDFQLSILRKAADYEEKMGLMSPSFRASRSSKETHIKNSISSHGKLLRPSILSYALGEATFMHGWDVSMAKGRDIMHREWRHIWRRTHMGHSHGHDHDHGSHEKLGAYGEKILKWGLWSDIFLTVGKVAAGYISGSTAIVADAAHSASDIVLSGVALWSSKASKAAPDQEHPYGHGKFETLGAMGISMLLLVTGGGIAWAAIDNLQVLVLAMLGAEDTIVQGTMEVHGHGYNHEHGFGGHKHSFDMEHMEVALFAAIVGIGAKEGLYWITKAAGEKSGSALLKATAWHHRGDSISTIVALIGVGGAMMGMPLLDPVAAVLVSGMIVKAGLENGYQSMQELLDKGLPQSILAPISKTVLRVDGVKGLHQLRGRRMGSIVHVDVHIKVDPGLTVSAAHTIGEAVRQQVRAYHSNVTEIYIHIDPSDGRPSLSVPEGMVLENSYDDKHYAHDQKHSHDCQHAHDRHDHEHPVDTNVRQAEVERIVQNVLQANFHEVVKVRAVTCHISQGKVVAEVRICFDSDLSIREAARHASDIEACLLKNVDDLATVTVQLDLSS